MQLGHVLFRDEGALCDQMTAIPLVEHPLPCWHPSHYANCLLAQVNPPPPPVQGNDIQTST